MSTTPTAPEGRLAGKVAIVTGVGSGIGKGCALKFAREGAIVIGCDIDADAAACSASEAAEQGLVLEIEAPVDLRDEQGCEQLAAKVAARHGGVDALVNAAAMAVFAPVDRMTLAQWRHTIVGELDLVFLACRAVWPHMVSRGGGAIINFASANAYGTLAGSYAVAHCAGKGGVLAMTRQLAAEGAPHGIRANTISPGPILTGATEAVFTAPHMVEPVMSKLMIKRLGLPADVANAAAFLASDEASYVTAADLKVDGGATAC